MHWNKKACVTDLYVCQNIFGLQQLYTFARINYFSDAMKIEKNDYNGKKMNIPQFKLSPSVAFWFTPRVYNIHIPINVLD